MPNGLKLQSDGFIFRKIDVFRFKSSLFGTVMADRVFKLRSKHRKKFRIFLDTIYLRLYPLSTNFGFEIYRPRGTKSTPLYRNIQSWKGNFRKEHNVAKEITEGLKNNLNTPIWFFNG